MDLNRTILIFITVFMAISSRGYSQQVELGINLHAGLAHSQGWEPGMNGASLNLDYFHVLRDEIRLKGGMELGYTGWGNQGLIAAGIRYGGVSSLELEILNGMAFYQQGPHYVFGTGGYYSRSFFNAGKNRLLLSIGLRYTIQPAYRDYSNMYAYFDLPLRIRWQRQLNHK